MAHGMKNSTSVAFRSVAFRSVPQYIPYSGSFGMNSVYVRNNSPKVDAQGRDFHRYSRGDFVMNPCTYRIYFGHFVCISGCWYTRRVRPKTVKYLYGDI